MPEIHVGAIEQGIQEVKDALKDVAFGLFPKDKSVISVQIEYFSTRPDLPTDAGIFGMVYSDRSQVDIIRRKTTNGNQFSHPGFLMIPGGGLDSRRWETIRLEWDGHDLIKFTDANGDIAEGNGQSIDYDEMVQTLRSALGRTRGVQAFANIF